MRPSAAGGNDSFLIFLLLGLQETLFSHDERL
jgi:hypothetical protein